VANLARMEKKKLKIAAKWFWIIICYQNNVSHDLTLLTASFDLNLA
jgi:hypothetical protein